jgi:glucose-1-phosphate thymidylyltransferase
MDMLILCGGYATRLGDIAYFTPKQLLPLSGRPVIDYIFESAAALDIDRIIVSTNSKFADQFEYWLKLKRAAGYSKPIELIVEQTRTNGEKLGALKGMQYAIKKANVTGDLMVVAGDNFYNFPLARMLSHYKKYGKPTIAIFDIKSKEESRRFGVVTVESNRITSFEEKPKEPKSTLVSTGIYLFPKDALEKLDGYIQAGTNTDNLGSFLQWLISGGEVHGLTYVGEWFDIGTVDTYRKIFDSYMDRRIL